ncbi:MAG: hypothetical protein KF819_07645 [Labilithrix sp.]|nr:hypothetical protein [Labilithrix sp.]
MSADETLTAWREHDAQHALHAVDDAAIAAADAPRALVLELLAKKAEPSDARDLYNACARLGRLLAEAGASPTLAIATIDGAAKAIARAGEALDERRLMPCRASLAEGYCSVVVESERAAARRGWEYPSCAVRIDDRTVAIVAAPGDDDDAVADWAARVALGASKDRYARAHLGEGDARTRAELEQALSLVGIAVARGREEPRSWLRFWKR